MNRMGPKVTLRGWSALSIAFLAVIVAACSHGRADAGGTTTTVKSSSTTAALRPEPSPSEPSLTTTSTTIAEDPVLVAYLDFWELYVELGGAPPPFDPIAVNARLEELTTDPESAQLFDFFQRNAATGLVLRGDIGHTPTVLSNDGTTAMVDDCADDRLGVYRVADDSRVDTDDPARRTYTATLRQVDGVWRVERVDAEGTPCAE